MPANNIKKLREKAGYQQQEFARLIGYKSLAKYNEIEQGKRGLPIAKAVKAAEILKCSLDDIFLP